VKYKTLPPSVLFKNRLYIERDSKHRRILSNFGLNFRNSKWANYETYNVKNQFRSAYFKYFLNFFVFIFIVFLLWYFDRSYILKDVFNSIFSNFWLGMDSFDYVFSFVCWLLLVVFSSIFNFLNSFFFFNSFSKKKTMSQWY